jgi:hypothetical protein
MAEARAGIQPSLPDHSHAARCGGDLEVPVGPRMELA